MTEAEDVPAPTQLRRPWLRGLANLFFIGLAGAPVVISVAALSGIGHRWIDILAQFTAPALIGALALALATHLLRLRPAFWVASAVSALTLIAFWPQGAPGGPKADPASPIVTLYFANLYMGNDDVKAIRTSIAAANPDVVVLVEMSNAVTAQADMVLAGYPHRAIERRAHGPRGDRITIASRQPLVSHRVTGSELAVAAATVQTALGSLDVLGVHLTRPWPYQYQWGQIIQTMQLGENVARARHPVVVAGDFNSVSSARIGRQMKSDLGLIPAPGWPGTWPAQAPSVLGITIDQIYHDRRLAVIDRRLGLPTGSDHRPVIVRVSRARP